MKKYDSFKKTTLKGLPTIPAHWNLCKVKDIALIKGRIGFRGYTKGDFVEKNQGGLVIGATEMTDKGNIVINNPQFLSWEKYYESPEIILKLNDILIVQRGSTVGKVAMIGIESENATINPSLVILKKVKCNNKYLLYFFMSPYIQGFISTQVATTAIPMISQEQIGNYEVVLPSLPEQTAIATYLDHKTQAIDKKVALLTQKAAYYKELRKALINRAVMEGIAENMEIKDSGVEWIGRIPRHWEVKRLKDLGYLYSGLSGKAGDDFNQEDNPNNKGFIPFTNIANNTYLKKDHLGAVVIFEKEKQNKVKKGDIFFLMSSEGHEDIGKTAVLDDEIKETYLNSFCKGFRLTKKFCYPNFINYLLLSTNYRSQFIVEGKGFTRINLKMEKVTDFSVFLPPTLQEQIAIATYLDEKTSVIDAIVANIEKQVVTLKELRKTLINEVVTGKVKITND
jgi:type I restriction enzyme, S subunit